MPELYASEAAYYDFEAARKIKGFLTKCDLAGKHTWTEMKNTREGWSLCKTCGRATMCPALWDEKVAEPTMDVRLSTQSQTP